MFEEQTKQDLQRVLEEEIKAIRTDIEARAKLDKQIQERQERITAIQKLLGRETLEGQPVLASERIPSRETPREPRKGTVTDEIRRVFEANPNAKGPEVVAHIRSMFPNSRIDIQSFSIWDSYFRNGRYLMDRDKYRIRYRREPSY